MNGRDRRALSAATTRSQCSSRVAPTPTAGPCTAATTILRVVDSARMKGITGPASGWSPRSGGLCMKSCRSLPALKAPPSPASTMTRIAASASARRKASTIASYIGTVKAFFLSARLKRISSTPAAALTRMLSDMEAD